MATRVVNKYKEAYDVSIGRDGPFGNPFPIIKGKRNRAQAIEEFRKYFYDRINKDEDFRKAVLGLRGKTLGCYCKPKPCHGDIIVEYINKEASAMPDIKSFTGEYMWLSNFYFTPEVRDRLWDYPTVEHAYQAAKTLDRTERRLFKTSGMTAGQAKRAGRKLQIRNDWEEVKDDVMLTCLRAKFAPDSALAQKLLDTGDAVLIEGNHWHDQYWGSCTCNEHKLVPGENRLGRLLMQVRDELRR